MARKDRKGPTLAEQADRYRLYETAVQNPGFELDFIDETFEALCGRKPHRMREDFCGTAISSVEWVARHERHEAIAVDLDPVVLDWARANNVVRLDAAARERLTLLEADVRTVDTEPVDVIQAYNFSYWFFHRRREMLAYFKRLHTSLVADGLLFLDVFGGSDCYRVQKEKRKLDGFSYIWEQASFNAVTNELTCHIHFRFPDRSRLDRAFSYEWRVWGARELREVLDDAGFSETLVYRQAFDEETDEPLDEYVCTEAADDYGCWLGYLIARP